VSAAAVAGAIVVPTVASATPHTSPTQPTPTIDSVQKQLGHLALRNDQLVERFNQANEAYTKTRAAAGQADLAYRAAQAKLAEASRVLSVSAAAQYEGGAFSATGALLSSSDGSSYLDQLDTLSMLSAHNAQTVTSFTAAQSQAKTAKATAHRLLAAATAKRAAVEKQRVSTRKQIAKYTSLLATLNAQQRAAWARRASPTAAPSQVKAARSVNVTSSQVRAAVNFALDQVGKPYVFGAAGPGSYDCSGLTMAAYAAAGVSLPHSAADQFNYGHHVNLDQLAPGDLMFFYSPIGHVTIYIGDGMMVPAPQTGENVKVVPAAAASDFVGATRLIG